MLSFISNCNQRYIEFLSTKLGLSIDELVQIIGTKIWVHPLLAIHLAFWVSDDFAFNISLVTLISKSLEKLCD